MENKASKSIVTMLIFSFLVGSGLAQWTYEPVSSLGPSTGNIGGFSDQKGVYECFYAFYTIAPSCVTELLDTASSGRFELGPACCNMIQQVKDDCWKILFPISPDLPPIIKQQCDKYEGK